MMLCFITIECGIMEKTANLLQWFLKNLKTCFRSVLWTNIPWFLNGTFPTQDKLWILYIRLGFLNF